MIFKDVVVSPFTDLLEGPSGGFDHRGGPAWPDFDRQTTARHCRSGKTIDVAPTDLKPTDVIDEPAAWGGPLIRHYGHALAEFSMRLAPTADEHGSLPMLFATKPGSTGINSIDEVPGFLGAIWRWFDVYQPRMISQPTLVRELAVAPQAEQLGGPGPSSRHLDLLDEHASRKLGALSSLPPVYISRATQRGHFAGELYVERVMTAAGVLVVRPERLGLVAQLRLYASSEHIIFSEGSAIHTTQLLGHLQGSVSVILRRPWRFAAASVEPRVRHIKYVHAIRGTLMGVLPGGVPDPGNGLTVLDTNRLRNNLVELVPGLAFDPAAYEKERDAEVIRWIESLEPSRVGQPDTLLSALVAEGLAHLVPKATGILRAKSLKVAGVVPKTPTPSPQPTAKAAPQAVPPVARFRIPHPFIPPATMRSHSEENYLASAVRDIEHIDGMVTIESGNRILDVGCAAGRLSLPLLDMLDPDKGGSYEGFDVNADSITWAERTIGGRYGNFCFSHIDAANSVANPRGKLDAASLKLPYRDAAFDLIIANGLFPHVTGEVAWNYLAELRRLLAPSGSIYSTWFLWDEQTAEQVETLDSAFKFRSARDGYRLANPARPEATVAYPYDHLVTELDRVGLRVTTETRGNWRARGNQGEDILILAGENQGAHG
jgi:SAM-dependent methyltransferase